MYLIVESYLICGKSRHEVAEVLFMSKRSVDRYLALYNTTGILTLQATIKATV